MATPDMMSALADAAKVFGLEVTDRTPPKDGWVKANGLRMHYLDWGGSGKPVLFLHGGNQTAHTWDLAITKLRRDFHCLALDQRGHGETKAPKGGDTNPQAQREDVRAAIEALGLKRLALVGMSMGGLNTIAYSGTYPERLAAICIVDVGPTILKKGFDETGSFIRSKREFASMEEALDYAVGFNPTRPKAHLRYSLMHALKQRPDGTWVWRYDQAQPAKPEERKKQAEKVLTAYNKLWDIVPNIRCPALVVQGSRSNVFTPELAAELAGKMPKGRWITIQDAGHTVQGDQPKAFADALRAFLRDSL